MNEKRWKTLVKKTLFDRVDADEDLGVLVFQTCFNFVTGVKDRRMVFTSEELTDLRIRHIQFRAAQEHTDLARDQDLLAALVGHDIIYRDVVGTGDNLDDQLRCDLSGLFWGDHVFKSDLRII